MELTQFSISDALPYGHLDRESRQTIRERYTTRALNEYMDITDNTDLTRCIYDLPSPREVRSYMESQPHLRLVLTDTSSFRGSSEATIAAMEQTYAYAGAYALKFFDAHRVNIEVLPTIDLSTILASRYDGWVRRPGYSDTAGIRVSYPRVQEPQLHERLAEAIAQNGAAATIPRNERATRETGAFERTAYMGARYIMEQLAILYWQNIPRPRARSAWK